MSRTGFSYDAMIHSANDANGNTLSDAQGRTFTWDFENRLPQAVTSNGTTTFKYYPFGRRIRKTITAPGSTTTTTYLYDRSDIIEAIAMRLVIF